MVTSVAAAHPPFAFLWSAVKECFIGAPTECCCCTIKGACLEAAHMSPATQRITIGTGRKLPAHIAIYKALILNFRPCEARNVLFIHYFSIVSSAEKKCLDRTADSGRALRLICLNH